MSADRTVPHPTGLRIVGDRAAARTFIRDGGWVWSHRGAYGTETYVRPGEVAEVFPFDTRGEHVRMAVKVRREEQTDA